MKTREDFQKYLLSNGYKVHYNDESKKVFVKLVKVKSLSLKFDAFCQVSFDNTNDVVFSGLALGVRRELHIPIGTDLDRLIAYTESIYKLIAEAYSIASKDEILKHFEQNTL